MGLRPHEVRTMSLPDFAIAVQTWNETHGAGGPDYSQDAVAELEALMEAYPDGR